MSMAAAASCWQPEPPCVRVQWGHCIAWAALVVAFFVSLWIGFEKAEAPFYPRFYDQVDYRRGAAELAVSLRNGDFEALLRSMRELPAPQGFLHVVLGAVGYRFGIDPVFVMLAAFLLCLWAVWRSFTDLGRSPWIGWLAVVLLCSTKSLVLDLGGPTDFRADFLAQSLWCAVAALAAGSLAFAHRGRAIAAGIVLGLLFCTRSITVLYAVAGLPLVLLAIVIGTGHSTVKQQLGNLGRGALAASFIALPFFILESGVMWDYYISNHASPREIAARGSGFDFCAHLRYYWSNLCDLHLGRIAFWLMGGAVLYGLASHRLRMSRVAAALGVLMLAFVLALFVMSLAPHYNPVVPGIIVGPLVLLTMLPIATAPPRWRLRSTVKAALLIAGLCVWPIRFLHTSNHVAEARRERGHLNAVAVQHAILEHTKDRKQVVLSILTTVEAISVPMLELLVYEREGRLPGRFVRGLGHSLYATPSEKDFADSLLASDVVVWWDRSIEHDLPSNQEVTARRALVERLLAQHFTPAAGSVAELPYEGSPLRLYLSARGNPR